ncbi:MAG: universal stress protein [Polyangiaceae bacterium]|nr:universal stress protein [Polyangiaceae bacterium]NUQ73090.1 universal stress protein [Polyangiaceae bacterium]
MATFNRILVPTDFSSFADQALEVAVRLVSDFNASLTLMHVWELPTYVYAELTYAPIDLLTPVESAARAQLHEALAKLKKQVPDAKAVLHGGFPPEEILRGVGDANADLIVMGTHGRRGLSHLLLGSVAERVVRTSPVPVLTIRSK